MRALWRLWVYVFGLGGRISRGAFWLRVGLIWAVFAGLTAMLGDWPGAVWLVNPLALLALLAACARRLHDRDRFGLWLLVALVPVLGALWLMWQLALRRGVAFTNRWGPDPKAQAEYQMQAVRK